LILKRLDGFDLPDFLGRAATLALNVAPGLRQQRGTPNFLDTSGPSPSKDKRRSDLLETSA
jgi:hypothetical protein